MKTRINTTEQEIVCHEVYNKLGVRFSEKIYKNSVAIKLNKK